MKVQFTEEAWEDYLHWPTAGREKIPRINTLIRDIQRSPYEGIGQPEALRFDLAGHWSRRIDQQHRLIYRVGDDAITVIQCRYHY